MVELLKWAQESGKDAVIAALVLFAMVDTTLAWGLAPGVFEGFSPKTGMQQLHDKIDTLNKQQMAGISSIRELLLQNRLNADRQAQCDAIKKSAPQALKQRIVNDIEDLRRQFFIETGRMYDLRPCEEY